MAHIDPNSNKEGEVRDCKAGVDVVKTFGGLEKACEVSMYPKREVSNE